MKKSITILLGLVLILTLSSCTFFGLSYNEFDDSFISSYRAAESVSRNKHILYYYNSNDDASEEIKTEILNFFTDFELLDFYLLDTSNVEDTSSTFGAYIDQPIIYVVSDNEPIETYTGESEIKEFIQMYNNIELDYDTFESQHLTTYDEVLSIDRESYILYYYFENCPYCIETKPHFLPWAFTRSIEDVYFMNGAVVQNADQIPTELLILNSGTPILVLMSNGKFDDEYYSGTEEVMEYLDTVADQGVKTSFDYDDFEDFEMENHDETLTISNNVHFEYFYSPYCVHCETIKNDILGFFYGLGSTEFYVMNSSGDKGVAKIEGFGGVPALYIVANNEVVEEYKGSRAIPEFLEEFRQGKIDLSKYE